MSQDILQICYNLDKEQYPLNIMIRIEVLKSSVFSPRWPDRLSASKYVCGTYGP